MHQLHTSLKVVQLAVVACQGQIKLEHFKKCTSN